VCEAWSNASGGVAILGDGVGDGDVEPGGVECCVNKKKRHKRKGVLVINNSKESAPANCAMAGDTGASARWSSGGRARMHVRVHEVAAAAERGCDGVRFDGSAGLGSVGARVDTGVGSEIESAEAQALIVVVVEGEESHVQHQRRCQRPCRAGESGGTGKPYQTLNENPCGVASKKAERGQLVKRREERGRRGERKRVVRERECYQGQGEGLHGRHDEIRVLGRKYERNQESGATVERIKKNS
jgi:hypothetical protein